MGLAVVCTLCPCLRAQAETLTSAAYRIDIANNLVWYDNQGQPIVQATASRLSVLQRWNLQSQPNVRITNTSSDISLVGVQLDLSNSASKIISCTWLETPGQADWNWNDSTASAYFQFLDPIAPGGVVSMRLGTAARTSDPSGIMLASSGANLTYTMNQSFFHPCIAGCVDTNMGYGEFTVFSRPASDTAPPVFDPTGLPVGDTIVQQTVNLGDYPLTSADINDPASGTSTIVPVPEPHTIALAASAAAVVAARFLGRRRAA
ncbi:MAG: hypothetical protein WCR51_01615 [Planctomycetia bacterium]